MVILVIFFALLLRLLPIILHSTRTGVDHWFWKTYIETYRETGQFPPVLPRYLLDEHQWYPPLFPLLLAKLTPNIFNKHSQLSAVAIDLVRMVLLLVVLSYLFHGSTRTLLIAGLVYATMPRLISYNTQLNPRGLGALFLDGAVVLAMWIYFFHGPLWAWVLVLFLAGLILLTHKMTTQLFWFLCLGAALFSWDWRFLLFLPLSVLAAAILSKGFYFKVWRAQWDIVAFWYRNWPLLHADPLKESPLYGIPGYSSPAKVFKPGARYLIKMLGSMLAPQENPWMLCAILSGFLVWIGKGFAISFPIVGWLFLCYLFAILTISIKSLRCIGYGELYLYNAAFPAALLLGLLAENSLVIVLIAIFLIINLYGIYRALAWMKVKGLSIPDDLLQNIRNCPDGSWLAYPMQLCEHLAYLAEKPVLWGAHGYGFKLVEQVFPVVRVSFASLKAQYGLKYFLVYEEYLADFERIDIPTRIKFSSGAYHVLELI